MAIQDLLRNAAADGAAATIAALSLHTADGSTTGTNEITGYTRQTPSFSSAIGGTASMASLVTFTITGASSGSPIVVTHVGMWTSGGAWLGSQALPSSRTITTSPYLFRLDTFTVPVT